MPCTRAICIDSVYSIYFNIIGDSLSFSNVVKRCFAPLHSVQVVKFVWSGLFIVFLPFSAQAQQNPFDKKWQPIVDWFNQRQFVQKDLSHTQFLKEIKTVNRTVNRYTFKNELWDPWFTPSQFFDEGGGDCEDFSIAKMYKLASRGVPLDQMEIWILRKNSIQSHAVLAVQHKSHTYILDNYVSNPYSVDDLLRVYNPLHALSINNGWRRLNAR